MKLNEKMKVRQVAGENVVIMPGAQGTDMTRVVALNESAMVLYNSFMEKEFDVEDVVRVLTDEYEITDDEARRDADAWVAEMKKNNLIV
ncbi:MAG: PqqD family protein [Bacteroidales bacterium]|nr:PqqD family protein [Bacteroidales bacterium]